MEKGAATILGHGRSCPLPPQILRPRLRRPPGRVAAGRPRLRRRDTDHHQQLQQQQEQQQQQQLQLQQHEPQQHEPQQQPQHDEGHEPSPVTLVLDHDFHHVTSSEESLSAFHEAFTADLCKSLGIDPSMIEIVSV
jgi:hypothetical protein